MAVWVRYSEDIFPYCAWSVASLPFCCSSFLLSTSDLALSASVLVSPLSYCDATSFISEETSRRFCVMFLRAARYSLSPTSFTAPPKLAISNHLHVHMGH